MFIDRAKVYLSAGKGGNGVVAWRREKFIPKGGPSGGNGGKGGSVILEVDEQIYSLDWYRHRRILKAENGKGGGSNNKQGGRGQDLILKLPCGTLVKDVETGELLYDLTEPGQRMVLCTGGKGGRGNDSFKTPTNQAPNYCTPGKEGESCHVEFELKLIADIGLIGFPNAGKSTLFSSLSDVNVKTAAYPFTTLTPNLGFIAFENFHRLYIADIPGIIEGAHLDRGLGLEFLRHIERTKLLIFVLDASGIDNRTPADDYRVLCEELQAYKVDLSDKPFLIALNKVDTEESRELIRDFLKQNKKLPKEKIFQISALTGEGLEELKAEFHSEFINAIDHCA
jgi:GTPase